MTKNPLSLTKITKNVDTAAPDDLEWERLNMNSFFGKSK